MVVVVIVVVIVRGDRGECAIATGSRQSRTLTYFYPRVTAAGRCRRHHRRNVHFLTAAQVRSSSIVSTIATAAAVE